MQVIQNITKRANQNERFAFLKFQLKVLQLCFHIFTGCSTFNSCSCRWLKNGKVIYNKHIGCNGCFRHTFRIWLYKFIAWFMYVCPILWVIYGFRTFKWVVSHSIHFETSVGFWTLPLENFSNRYLQNSNITCTSLELTYCTLSIYTVVRLHTRLSC